MQDHAVHPVHELAVPRPFQRPGRFRPAGVARMARERLGLDDRVRPAIRRRGKVPEIVGGRVLPAQLRTTPTARIAPEFGHQAVDRSPAQPTVDRAAVGFAGELKPHRVQAPVADPVACVAVELADGQVEVLFERAGPRGIIDGEPGEGGQERQRIVAAPGAELFPHPRRPGRRPRFIAVGMEERDRRPQHGPEMLAELGQNGIPMRMDGIGAHLVALPSRSLRLAGAVALRLERMAEDVRAPTRRHARNRLPVDRPVLPARHGAEGPLAVVVDDSSFVRSVDGHDKVAHRVRGRRPGASCMRVPGAVVQAKLDAALPGLFGGIPHERPPIRRERDHVRLTAVGHLLRARRTGVRHAKDRRRRDAHAREPVKILPDPLSRHMAPHPVPPDARMCLRRGGAKDGDRVGRGRRGRAEPIRTVWQAAVVGEAKRLLDPLGVLDHEEHVAVLRRKIRLDGRPFGAPQEQRRRGRLERADVKRNRHILAHGPVRATCDQMDPPPVAEAAGRADVRERERHAPSAFRATDHLGRLQHETIAQHGHALAPVGIDAFRQCDGPRQEVRPALDLRLAPDVLGREVVYGDAAHVARGELLVEPFIRPHVRDGKVEKEAELPRQVARAVDFIPERGPQVLRAPLCVEKEARRAEVVLVRIGMPAVNEEPKAAGPIARGEERAHVAHGAQELRVGGVARKGGGMRQMKRLVPSRDEQRVGQGVEIGLKKTIERVRGGVEPARHGALAPVARVAHFDREEHVLAPDPRPLHVPLQPGGEGVQKRAMAFKEAGRGVVGEPGRAELVVGQKGMPLGRDFVEEVRGHGQRAARVHLADGSRPRVAGEPQREARPLRKTPLEERLQAPVEQPLAPRALKLIPVGAVIEHRGACLVRRFTEDTR